MLLLPFAGAAGEHAEHAENVNEDKKKTNRSRKRVFIRV